MRASCEQLARVSTAVSQLPTRQVRECRYLRDVRGDMAAGVALDLVEDLLELRVARMLRQYAIHSESARLGDREHYVRPCRSPGSRGSQACLLGPSASAAAINLVADQFKGAPAAAVAVEPRSRSRSLTRSRNQHHHLRRYVPRSARSTRSVSISRRRRNCSSVSLRVLSGSRCLTARLTTESLRPLSARA